jgi:hypothetical protein
LYLNSSLCDSTQSIPAMSAILHAHKYKWSITMASTYTSGEEALTKTTMPPQPGKIDYARVNGTAVSWDAILAGAVATAALTLILFLLGSGIGFASVSPWMRKGIDASSFGIWAIFWLTLTQLLASGLGGYLTGRLRARWPSAHADEVYFRDTAHGFLAWAVATLVVATLLTSASGSMVNAGVQTTVAAANGAMNMSTTLAKEVVSESTDNHQMAYWMASLLRPDANMQHQTADDQTSPTPTLPASTAAPVAEMTRIFAHALSTESLAATDLTYLGLLISQHTGLTPQESESRVNTLFSSMQASKNAATTKAKEAVEQARKATVYISLWLFASLLIGAFAASLAATCGGRCRDT